MKTILCTCLLIAATGALMAATNEVPTLAELDRMFMEAVTLKQQGRYAEAEVRLKRLGELQPDKLEIKQMLVEVQQKEREKQADPVQALKRKLEELIVPEVNFRGAAVRDVVDFLRDESRRLDKEKVGINIVWRVPDDAASTKITLSLRKVSLGDVLHYVAEVAGLKYRVDGYAVVIYKPEPPAPKEPPSPNAPTR